MVQVIIKDVFPIIEKMYGDNQIVSMLIGFELDYELIINENERISRSTSIKGIETLKNIIKR